MKKSFIFAALFATIFSAHAASVQVEGGRGSNANVGYVALSEKVLGIDTQVGYQNQLSKGPRTDSISVGVAPTIATVANTTISAYFGGQYGRAGKAEGFGVTYGVGVAYPITKQVDVIADFRRTEAQSRVKAQTGNTAYAGVSVKF